MAEIQHRDIPISQNHSPFRWIVPDQAGRDSIVNFEGNGNKLLLQHDTRQIFYLREEVVVVGQPPEYSWVEIGTSIEDADNWDEAYSWGDHALVGYAMSDHTHIEADITDLDKYTQSEVDTLLSTKADNNSISVVGKSGSYNDLLNIPSVFTPSYHTHVEADITDLDKYTQSQVDTLLTAKEDTTNKGVADGYASLDSTGKVPSAQLPSFVDDVEEYATENDFPVTGEQGKLYIALDTNKVYRWSGTTYIYITSGAVDSVNNKTGVVSLTTTDIPEDINLYFTEQRVRDSVSASGDLSYSSASGEFSVTTYKSTDFDTDFASKSTTDLSEGTNLYHTQQRVRDSISASGDINYNSVTGEFSATTYKSTDFDSDLATKSTTDLSEGANLYFTEQRAKDALSTELSGKVDKGSIIVSSNTTAEVNTRYHFSAAVTLTLPTATKGDVIHVSKDSGVTPTINGSITYQGTTDTTLEYDFDIGINLVYDGSTWILLHT